MADPPAPGSDAPPPGALLRLDAIPDGGARGFRVATAGGATLRAFAVRRGERVHAYVNRCPHVGTPLDWVPDDLLDRDGRFLVCATHGARFRVEDGLCVAGPCQGESLEPLAVEVRDGWLHAAGPRC